MKIVETCSVHITLYNKNSCADVQISVTIHIQALRDVFIQISDVSLGQNYIFFDDFIEPQI